MSEILRVENIEKYYGNRFSLTKAVDRMSLRVEKGEFVAIMGASGSGKTTLLNCIATIDRVSSGRIYVDGRDITRLRGNALVRFRRDSIGFVFQEFNLLDTMTAYENIALALQIQKVKEKEIRTRIAHVANLLGIESIMAKYRISFPAGRSSVWLVRAPSSRGQASSWRMSRPGRWTLAIRACSWNVWER